MLLEKVTPKKKKIKCIIFIREIHAWVFQILNIVGVYLTLRCDGVETSGPVGFSCRFLVYLLYFGVYFHAIPSKMAYRRFP